MVGLSAISKRINCLSLGSIKKSNCNFLFGLICLSFHVIKCLKYYKPWTLVMEPFFLLLDLLFDPHFWHDYFWGWKTCLFLKNSAWILTWSKCIINQQIWLLRWKARMSWQGLLFLSDGGAPGSFFSCTQVYIMQLIILPFGAWEKIPWNRILIPFFQMLIIFSSYVTN